MRVGTGAHARMRGYRCLRLRREPRTCDDLYQALQWWREKYSERGRHHKGFVASTQRGADGSNDINRAFR
ncbi:hypothetical protein BDI4_740016 [Burkholderia diffusa]|nr:hypothetical protein BDI4_740016 [Burkholderia diffusa]